jgi:hypothetical protein
MIIQTFAVMARSEASEREVRDLLDALDGGEQSDRGDEAAAILGAHRSPEITELLRAHLRRAISHVGPTELTQAMLARLSPDEIEIEQRALHALYFALGSRRALVRRTAEALAERRSLEAWRDLARVATEHPSAALRAAAAGAMIGVRGEGGDERALAAPVELLGGLVDAVDNRDNDTWSIELRRYGAEAAMILDRKTAYDRLARHLVHFTEREPELEYTIRGIAAAWFARMKPEDDPRFARALCELLDANASVPIVVRGVLGRGAIPEAIEGALAALERVIAGRGKATPYLFEALAHGRDARLTPALLRALDAPSLAPLTGSILRVLEAIDEVAALPDLEARMAALAPGDKRLKLFRATAKHLGRNAPRKSKAKVATAATPEALAPGLPVWYAPPAMSPPRAADASLLAALAGLPSPDAEKSLAAHRDARATALVRARLLEAADGLCDYSWHADPVQALTPAQKGRVRKAYGALHGPIHERVALVRSLAIDLARRWDVDGDGALIELLAHHRYPELRETLAPALVEAEPSRTLLEAIAARIDDPRLGVQSRQLDAAAQSLFLLGEARALSVAERCLGSSEHPAVRVALVRAAAKHLDARSDRRWVRLLADDARASTVPIDHFTALARLADPSSVDAIGDAMEPLMEHGGALEHAVRAFVTLGDPRGSEHILRMLENPKFSIWFGEGAEALRKLGGPKHLDRIRALQAAVRGGKDSWRNPALLDPLIADWSKR